MIILSLLPDERLFGVFQQCLLKIDWRPIIGIVARSQIFCRLVVTIFITSQSVGSNLLNRDLSLRTKSEWLTTILAGK